MYILGEECPPQRMRGRTTFFTPKNKDVVGIHVLGVKQIQHLAFFGVHFDSDELFHFRDVEIHCLGQLIIPKI